MVTPLPQHDPLSRHECHGPQLAVRDAVLAIVSTATALDAALQGALAEVCAGLVCEVGAIHLLSSDGRTFDLAAHVGLDAEARAALGVLPASEWPLAAVVQGGDLLALHDFVAHPGARVDAVAGA
jgi:GAF domain-containing protein